MTTFKLLDPKKEIKEAKKELTIISADEKNRTFYEMREASLHDRVSALEGAEEKGYKKAQKEIKKAQREKEKAQKEKEKAQKEKEKAQKEKEKAQKEKEILLVNTVKKFLSLGLSIKEISEAVNLEEDEINEFIDKSKK
jgi:penicillin-binding protein 2A